MSKVEQVGRFTASKILRILNNPSDSAARAALANLRRGVGHAPGELPQIWGDFLLDMPEELCGHGDRISPAEWAVYTAVTLFALHQQGKDRTHEPMHRRGEEGKPGNSLGAAANRLIENEDDRERIAHRFYPAATADDMAELSHHLRGLIMLFRAKGIPMDYVGLAGDLYRFQFPETKDIVRMKWGRDFCQYRGQNEEDNSSEE